MYVAKYKVSVIGKSYIAVSVSLVSLHTLNNKGVKPQLSTCFGCSVCSVPSSISSFWIAKIFGKSEEKLL